MIMSMLGIGAVSYHYQGADSQLYVAGFVAAIFHLINHATFKGALFMITGGVDHATGTRNVKKWWITYNHANFIHDDYHHRIKYGWCATI